MSGLAHAPIFQFLKLLALLSAVSTLGACVSYQHIPLEADEPVSVSERQAVRRAVRQANPRFSWQGSAPQISPFNLDEVAENNSGLKRKASVYLTRRMRGQQLNNYDVLGFEYPSSGASGQPGNSVRIRYYRGKVPGRWPLLVILPVWGSFEYPIEKVAKRVRDRYQGKVHIATVLGEQRLLDWDGMAAAEDADALRRHSEISAERIRVAVVDIRRLLDWAELQPEIDPQRIALTGFSIGAVVGSLVVTQEPRLAASTLIMGGANPAQLLTYCNRIAGRTRQEVTERLGMDEQQYLTIMSGAFDPLNLSNFRGSVDPSRVLVVDAGDDDCMPAAAREALWTSLDKPERYTIDGSHEGALLSMTFLGADFTGRLIVNFLEQQMDLGMPASSEAVAVEGPESDDSTL